MRQKSVIRDLNSLSIALILATKILPGLPVSILPRISIKLKSWLHHSSTEAGILSFNRKDTPCIRSGYINNCMLILKRVMQFMKMLIKMETTVADRTINGSIWPKFFGGLSNTLLIKILISVFFFSFQYGNKTYNHNRFFGEGGGARDAARIIFAKILADGKSLVILPMCPNRWCKCKQLPGWRKPMAGRRRICSLQVR